MIIPTTVTELFQANVNGNTGNIQTSSTTSKMVEDLYKILTKLAAENKVLKQSVQEQQEIINCEVIDEVDFKIHLDLNLLSIISTSVHQSGESQKFP